MRGPGIAPGQQIDAITMFADVCPTMLTLAGAEVPFTVDGRSFAHLVDPTFPTPPKPWKDTHIAEYLSISSKHCERPKNNCGGHVVDDATNTYRSMRVRNGTHDFLYAEFTDVTIAADWTFSPAAIQFVEYYNLQTDPFQLHNLYNVTSQGELLALRQRLQELFTCQGETCP